MAKRTYVDGFVVPVPKKRLKEYQRLAKVASKVWLEYGALDYVEAVGDGLEKGKVTSFMRSVKSRANEVVVFAFITYRSRKDRDRIMAKVMKDERLSSMIDMNDMPFDGMRMFWGGFKIIVQP